jgi:hypothetical protein
MYDYPERISISPVHRQKRDDDFYLVDRKAFPGKGVEYVRADMVTDFETHPVGTGKRIEELEAKLAKAVEAESEDSIEQLLADGELFDKATSEEETFYGCSPWEIWQMEEV